VTAAGSEFIESVDRFLTDLDLQVANARGIGGNLRGRLVISCLLPDASHGANLSNANMTKSTKAFRVFQADTKMPSATEALDLLTSTQQRETAMPAAISATPATSGSAADMKSPV
jgi:hypothetical protein